MKKGTLGIVLAVVILFAGFCYFAQASLNTQAEESGKKITRETNTKQEVRKQPKKKTASKKVTVKPKAVKKEDSIEMNITIKNNTKKDVFIEQSSGQVFDIQLLDANKNILYTWSADKSFIQVLSTTEIKAGKSLTYKEVLSGEVYDDIKDKVVYMKVYLTGTADFINADGYIVKVK